VSFVKAVSAQNVGDFLKLSFGYFFDLTDFALAFGGVVLGVGLGREVPAQSHRDRPGRDLGKARCHD
jgi:hypothetical protein